LGASTGLGYPKNRGGLCFGSSMVDKWRWYGLDETLGYLKIVVPGGARCYDSAPRYVSFWSSEVFCPLSPPAPFLASIAYTQHILSTQPTNIREVVIPRILRHQAKYLSYSLLFLSSFLPQPHKISYNVLRQQTKGRRPISPAQQRP